MNSVFGTLKPLQLLSVIVSPPAIALQKVLNQCADTLGAQHQHINISILPRVPLIATWCRARVTPYLKRLASCSLMIISPVM